MPWVKFLSDFNWSPPERRGRVTIAYVRGMKLLVRRKCAEQAVAAGAAIEIRKGEDDDARYND